MFSYSISDIFARFRLPLLLQLLVIVHDLAYKRKLYSVANHIDEAISIAALHYTQTGRIKGQQH